MTSDDGTTLFHQVWQAIADVFAAHATMLRDVQIIDEDVFDVLLGAIESVRETIPSSHTMHDLVGELDERVDAISPPEIRSTLQVGRGSADVQATVARLLWRKDLIDLATVTNDLRSTLIELAEQHVVSLIPAYTGGHPSQPTTIAHLLGGVIEPLQRAFQRLRSAFDSVNESPIGAVSLASTGLEIDPAKTSELLRFARPCANSFDAVSAVDHVVEALDATSAVVSPLRRLLDELLQWLRVEPTALLLVDDHQQPSQEMPHSQNHAKLTALARTLNAVERDAESHRRSLLGAPFGPIVGSDLDELFNATIVPQNARRAVNRFGNLFGSEMQFNRAVLANRAGKGMTTSTDLADFLMIEEQLPPGAARAIASRTISLARQEGREASGITPELIDSAALLVIGRELRVEFETISRYLAPRRFIERRALPGGPAPSTMRSYLGSSSARLDEDRRWLDEVDKRLVEGRTPGLKWPRGHPV